GGTICAALEHYRRAARVRHPPRRRHAGGGASSVAVAAAAGGEGLLHGLRQLLRGNSHCDAPPHRGAPPGPALASRRRLQAPDGAAVAQGDARFRYRAPLVHVDLRVALEGIKRSGALRPQAVLFACGLNSVRSPMAAALLKQMLGTSLYVGSAGVRKGEPDAFAAPGMEANGIEISAHRPHPFAEP